MALPKRGRIYTGVDGIPEGTQVYNKTGSTARLCADMGILNVPGPGGRRYPYTLVGIIEKEQNAPDYIGLDPLARRHHPQRLRHHLQGHRRAARYLGLGQWDQTRMALA